MAKRLPLFGTADPRALPSSPFSPRRLGGPSAVFDFPTRMRRNKLLLVSLVAADYSLQFTCSCVYVFVLF